MATLGVTTAYSARDVGISTYVLQIEKVTATEDGFVTSIVFYTKGNASGGYNERGFLFDGSGNYLGQGSQVYVSSNAVYAWRTSTFASPIAITSGNTYYLGWSMAGGTHKIGGSASTSANHGYESASITYSSPSGGFNPATEFTNNQYIMSLYAVYSLPGPPLTIEGIEPASVNGVAWANIADIS